MLRRSVRGSSTACCCSASCFGSVAHCCDYLLVDFHVMVGHYTRREMLFNVGAQRIAVNLINAGNTFNHFSHILNQETVLLMHDDFWCRTAVKGNNRATTR